MPAPMLLALAVLVGCGSDNGRVGISGEVSVDGVPIKSGSILLTRMDGERRDSAGAMIRDGAYAIPKEKGLLPGRYHLVLSAGDADAPQERVRDASGRSSTVARELIPAEYNVESDKTIDVSADGENHFVFSIESDAP